MSEAGALERAEFFFARRRFAEAERELRGALAQDPEDPDAHALLALSHLGQGRPEEALDAARTAVGKGPADAYPHYVVALVHTHREEPEAAGAAIEEAIRLDPEQARFFALRARVLLEVERWEEALTAAEQGLALDPEDGPCSTARARALEELGRVDEAAQALRERLARDPEDADAHAALGVLQLRGARYPDAQASFREALRLEPSHPGARVGLVEALKARHRLYGLFLRYVHWMHGLGERAGWALVLGLYLGYRYLLGLGRERPEWGPWINPLLGLYLAFALFTWTSKPIFDWLLSLDRFGRLSLDDDDRTQARWTSACLAGAAASAVLWATWSPFPGPGAVAGSVAFLIPLSVVFNCPGGVRRIAAAVAALLGAVGLEAVLFAVLAPYLAGEEREFAEGGAKLCGVGFFVGIGICSFGGQLLPKLGTRQARERERLNPAAESGRWTLLAFLTVGVVVSSLVPLMQWIGQGAPRPGVALRLLLMVGLFAALYRGAGWARWVLVVLYGLGAARSLAELAGEGPSLQWALVLPLVGFYVAFVAWLVRSKDLGAYLTLRQRQAERSR